MPRKSEDHDQRAASPVPQSQDDELEMADDSEEFEDEDFDEAGTGDDEDVDDE